MPSQIVPFIVLSKNKNLLSEFTLAKNSGSMENFITKYRAYVNGIKNRAAQTASIQVFDPSFIESFEHSFGFSTGGFDSTNTSVIEVTFLDPAADLENYLLNSLYSTDLIIPEAPKFAGVNFKRGNNIIPPKKGTKMVPFKDGYRPQEVDNILTIDDYAKIRQDELDSIVRDTEFTPHKDDGVTQLYWMAYGVGFNSCDWSNPMAVQRKSAEFKADGHSGRRVKLVFVPHPPEKYRSKDVVKNMDVDWVSDRVRETTLGDGKYTLTSRHRIDLFTTGETAATSWGKGLIAAGAFAGGAVGSILGPVGTVGGATGGMALVNSLLSDEDKESDVGVTRTDWDDLYTEIILGIYICIYNAYKVAMFGNEKERHNILLFLPNYHSFFLKRFKSIKDSKGLREKDRNAAFDLALKFIGSLGGAVQLIAEKQDIKNVGTQVDSDTMDFTKNTEGDAITIYGKGFKFYISITITDKINPQKDFEKLFLSLHSNLNNEHTINIDGSRNVNDFLPSYVFQEENDVNYLQIINEGLKRNYLMYGDENPLIDGADVISKEYPVSPFYLVGSKRLIDKYFYNKNPITGFPMNYNNSRNSGSDVASDVGPDMLALGFNDAMYDSIKRYQESIPFSYENSIFGDLHKLPKKTHQDITLGDSAIDLLIAQENSDSGKAYTLQKRERDAAIKEFKNDPRKKIEEVLHKAKIPVFNLGMESSNVLELNMDIDKVYQSIWINDYGYERKLLGVKALFSEGSAFKSDDFKKFNKLLNLLESGNPSDELEARRIISESEKEVRTLFMNNAVTAMNVMGTKATIKGADILNHAGAEGFPTDVKYADEETYAKYAAAHGVVENDAHQLFYDSLTSRQINNKGTSYLSNGDFSEFAKNVSIIYRDKQVDFILEVLKDMAAVTTKYPSVKLPSDASPFTPMNIHKDITSLIMSMPLVGKIKTLPYFGLSDYKSTIKTPCFLFGAEPVGAFADNNIRLSPGRFWFNGIYFISGYKHTINRNNVYSEFSIMRHG